MQVTYQFLSWGDCKMLYSVEYWYYSRWCAFQLEDVVLVDYDSHVKFSSEVVLYVDKYEIV